MANIIFEYIDFSGILTNGNLYGHKIAYFVGQA